jgi:hypothetical protein
MDATTVLAAILRDARMGALLRMAGDKFKTSRDEDHFQKL